MAGPAHGALAAVEGDAILTPDRAFGLGLCRGVGGDRRRTSTKERVVDEDFASTAQRTRRAPSASAKDFQLLLDIS
mgnify:CR=1 FL=1